MEGASLTSSCAALASGKRTRFSTSPTVKEEAVLAYATVYCLRFRGSRRLAGPAASPRTATGLRVKACDTRQPILYLLTAPQAVALKAAICLLTKAGPDILSLSYRQIESEGS